MLNKVIIQCIFSFLFIGWEPTTWSASNCLQIMVCSCLVPSKHVLLQIIFCSCVIEPCSWEKNDRSLLCVARKWLKYENKFGDRMIKQLLTSVIAKYGDLSVSHRSIICRSWRLRQIIDLVATDKSQYFAQPRPIIFNYSTIICKPHYLMPFLRCDLITQPQCWIKTV